MLLYHYWLMRYCWCWCAGSLAINLVAIINLMHNHVNLHVKVKVNQSRYRPGVAQSVPGSYGSQISWQRHRMVLNLSASRNDRLYPQEIHLVLISVRGWVDPRAVMITVQDGGKVVSLTHRPPLTPGNTPGTHFC